MRALYSSAVALGATVLFLILGIQPALCGTVEVRPTMLLITPGQHVATMTLMNPEDHPVMFQIGIYHWLQQDNQQQLDPSNDIIVSPPLVTLPAKGKQIVRIGLRGAAPADEKTYRLILEEVPLDTPNQAQSLNILLRVSVPLFVRPVANLPSPQLAAAMHMAGDDAIVTVRNTGRFTTRIASALLTVHAPNVQPQNLKQLTYIMPGEAANFTFAKAPPVLGSATVALETDNSTIRLEAPLLANGATDAPAPMAP